MFLDCLCFSSAVLVPFLSLQFRLKQFYFISFMCYRLNWQLAS